MTIEAGQRYDSTTVKGTFYTVLPGGPTTSGTHPVIVTNPNGVTHVGSTHQRHIDNGSIKLHVERPTLPEGYGTMDENGWVRHRYPTLDEARGAAKEYQRPWILHTFTDANGGPQVEIIEVDL